MVLKIAAQTDRCRQFGSYLDGTRFAKKTVRDPNPVRITVISADNNDMAYRALGEIMTIRFRALVGLALMASSVAAGAAKTGICAADGGLCYLFAEPLDDTGNLPVVFDNGSWTSELFTGSFGKIGDIPLIGDWDGDGKQDIGVYSDGYWHLRIQRLDQTWAPATTIYFGSANPLVKPVVGDWNGDGIDSIGLVAGIRWVLRSETGETAATTIIDFGTATSSPLVGDWNGDGIDTPAIVDDGALHYRNTLQYDDPETGVMPLPSLVTQPNLRPLAWQMRWKDSPALVLDVIAFIDPLSGVCSGQCNGGGAVVVVPGPGSW